MSESSEQPIEQALRSYASKRRQAADADAEAAMHPATRRMLQAEVARVHGRPSTAADASPSPRPAWWPRLVWAFGICLVLGAILAALLGPLASRSPDQLAKHSPPSTTPPDEPATPAPTSNPDSAPPQVPALKLSESTPTQPGSTDAYRQNAPVLQRDATPRFRDAVAAVPSNSLPIQPAADSTLTPLTPAARGSDALRLRSSAPPSQTPQWVGSYTRQVQPAAAPGFFAPSPEARRFRSANDTTAAAAVESARQPAAAKEILRAFQVDNVNGKLRLVDADGSAYVGHFAPASSAISRFASPTGAVGAATAPAQSTTPAAAPLEASGSSALPARFVVVGTNVTLGKLVIFAGTLKSNSTTNGAAATPLPEVSTLGESRDLSRASVGYVLEGKVTLGGAELGVVRAVQSPAATP